MPSFDNNKNGYVKYDPNINEKVRGGHCSLITGFVNNEDIPTGRDINSAAGGGYFIVKNSWGHSAGDGGYYYIPYAWANKWSRGMIALTSVRTFFS